MTRDDAMRKVRALLNTAAEGSGATEPERATARRLADKLMAAYGITEREVILRELARGEPPRPPIYSPPVVIVVGGFSFDFQSTTTTTDHGFLRGSW